MFIKSRCLYIINEEKRQSQLIYNEISKLDLVTKYFSASTSKDELLNFLSLLPDQTIFSKTVLYRENEKSRYFISLPFFSSHFKIPVKIGEYVWVYPYTQSDSGMQYNINSYWLSRVHGYAQSEDVNYTFNDRDLLATLSNLDLSTLASETLKNTKKSNQKRYQKERNKDLSNTIIKPSIDFGEKTFELDDKEVSYLSSDLINSKYRSIPHITKKSNDLILQGSNNTLIRLSTENSNNEKYTNKSSNTGEITISAGIGSFVKQGYKTKTGNFINNEGIVFEDKFYQIQTPENSKLPLSLSYDNVEERLKVPEMYSYQNLKSDTFNEGATNILEDASRITLSETYNVDSYVDNNFDTFLNISGFSNDLIEIEEDLKLFNSSNRSKNIKNIKKQIFGKQLNTNVKEVYNLPSINMTSSNISLFSRQGAGSLNLIKEYTNFNANVGQVINSYIKMNDEGDIFIDANRIFIGSAELEKKKGSFENGKGTIIRLGESEDSQSLVLGEQLKVYLLEILDVAREDMKETKLLFEETKKTFADINKSLENEIKTAMTNFVQSLPSKTTTLSTAIIGAGSSPITLSAATSSAITSIYSDMTLLSSNIIKAINNFSIDRTKIESNYDKQISSKKLKREEELSKRLEVVESNIDKILSKISKTS